jgi:oligopeptide/dipeptide ABC transporter ATP-binding protein
LEGLTKHFPVTKGLLFGRVVGAVHAVNGIDLSIGPGRTLALVGETGCGKDHNRQADSPPGDADLGRIVEYAETESIFAEPRHPYTKALFSAAPPAGRTWSIKKSFSPVRCRHHRSPKWMQLPHALKIGAICERETPALKPLLGASHPAVACHLS